MKLNEILNVVTYLINVNGGERRSVPASVFTDVLTKINLEYYFEMVRLEKYDYLKPFMVVKGDENNPALMVDKNGEVTTPTDMYKPISVTHRYMSGTAVKIRLVEIKDGATFDMLLADPIEYPTKEYPICTILNGIIKVAPVNLRYIGLKYIKLPTAPVYAVKPQDGVNVYDETASVELQWSEPDQINIIMLLMKDLGYHVSPEMINDAAKKQNK